MTSVAPNTPPRRVLRRLLLGALGLLVLGGILVWLSAPSWLAGELVRRLQSAAEARGLRATVARVEVDLLGEARLFGITLERQGDRLTVDTLTARFDPLAYSASDPFEAVRGLHVGSVAVTLATLDRSPAPAPAASRDPNAEGGRSETLRRALTWLDSPFSLRVEGPLPGVGVAELLSAEVRVALHGYRLEVNAEGRVDARVATVVHPGLSVGDATSLTGRALLEAQWPLRLGDAALRLWIDDGPRFTLRHGERSAEVTGLREATVSAAGISLSPLAVTSVCAPGEAGTCALRASRASLALVGGLPDALTLWDVEASAPAGLLPAALEPVLEAKRLEVHLDPDPTGARPTWRALQALGLSVTAHGQRFGLDAARLSPTSDGYLVALSGRFGPATSVDAHDGVSLPRLTGQIRVDRDLRPTTATLDLSNVGIAFDPTGVTRTLAVSPASRADLHLEARLEPDGRIVAQGTAALRDLVLQHWRIAELPVGPIEAAMGFDLVVDPARETARFVASPVAVGGARAVVALSLDGFDPRSARFTVDLDVPDQDCQALADAIPETLTRTIGRVTARGTAAGRAYLSVDLAHAESLDFTVQGDIEQCQLVSLGPVVDPKLASLTGRFKHTPVVDGEIVGPRVGPGTRSFVKLSKIPMFVRQAALSTEDGGFYKHDGLKESLVRGALKLNFEHRRYVYGGSTITQQLVKNLFLTRKKNIARKLEEAIIATAVERTLTKDRILELYLNCIEYGPKIWGIGNASKAYFAKNAEDLLPLEGAWLMAIKPYPVHAYYVARDRKWNERWVSRMRGVMEKLVRRGALPPEALDGVGPEYRPDFIGLRRIAVAP